MLFKRLTAELLNDISLIIWHLRDGLSARQNLVTEAGAGSAGRAVRTGKNQNFSKKIWREGIFAYFCSVLEN